MKSLIGLGLVTVYGLSVRLLFTLLDSMADIMSLGFLVVVPMIVGFLTIVLTPRRSTPNGVSAFFKPWLSCLVLLVITIILSIEGAICWVMVFPFFACLAGVGGLIAYYTRKPEQHDDFGSDWKKPDGLQLSALILLPLLVGLVEADHSSSTMELTTTQEVVISAKPGKVWEQLTSINEIASDERGGGLVSVLGFPGHITTTADHFSVGGTRTATYEKGLVFEGKIIRYVPEREMVLNVDIDPSKIPATVLDEHIVIGGRHVDVLQDAYHLEPLPDGSSRLQLTSRYSITTPFNWYAGAWARWLMSSILHGELDLIKQRSEKTVD